MSVSVCMTGIDVLNNNNNDEKKFFFLESKMMMAVNVHKVHLFSMYSINCERTLIPQRTVTNYFLVNLSLADIMVSTQNVIFNFIYMLNGDWPFGQFYCKVTNFIAIISVAASVFTLMAISIDR